MAPPPAASRSSSRCLGLLPRNPTASQLKQARRTFHNLRLSLLSGALTFIVLRSCIGAGKFRTPAQDLHDIRRRLAGAASQLHLISGGPYSLGPKISDWDRQLRSWRFTHHSSRRRRLHLLTASHPSACRSLAGDHYLLKSIKNKIDYCRLHSIPISYNLAQLDDAMTGFWEKLLLLRRFMLAHPEVEWIWWMNSDALFTDMAFELPIDKYSDYNIVLHGREELVYSRKAWAGLNTASFLLRNCQWSLDLLDVWSQMGLKGMTRDEAGKLLTSSMDGRPNFGADDQSALIHLLASQRGKWGDKVYLESSHYLHRYSGTMAEVMEKDQHRLGDDRWPLVTHFIGCNPCGESSGPSSQHCLKHMERAFNFADDQILQMYGLKHRSLDAAAVQPMQI